MITDIGTISLSGFLPKIPEIYRYRHRCEKVQFQNYQTIKNSETQNIKISELISALIHPICHFSVSFQQAINNKKCSCWWNQLCSKILLYSVIFNWVVFSNIVIYVLFIAYPSISYKPETGSETSLSSYDWILIISMTS